MRARSAVLTDDHGCPGLVESLQQFRYVGKRDVREARRNVAIYRPQQILGEISGLRDLGQRPAHESACEAEHREDEDHEQHGENLGHGTHATEDEKQDSDDRVADGHVVGAPVPGGKIDDVRFSP